MDNPINYAALAAECEAKAKAGVGPEMEWLEWPEGDCEKKISVLALLHGSDIRIYFPESSDDVRRPPIETFHMCFGVGQTNNKHFVSRHFETLVVAQLFAEALLRDATKPLHREAYAELATTKDQLQQTHGQIAEMCEYLGLKREDVPCDAWALRDAITRLKSAHKQLGVEIREQNGEMLKLQAENQRLRTALEPIVNAMENSTWYSDSDGAAIFVSIIEEYLPAARKAISPEASNG